MYIGKVKPFLARCIKTLPGRWFWLSIGLGLIIYGQTLMFLHDQPGVGNPALDVWNVFFSLEIINMQNLGAAIPYLLAGGLLSALAFLPDWNRNDEILETNEKKATLSLSLRSVEQARSILVLSWFLAGLFFLSCIAAFPPRPTHFVAVIPVLALFSAIGLAAVTDTFASELHNKRGWNSNPARNPPLFEDIVSWVAWRTEDPLTIVYIGVDENRYHRVQYHIDTSMVPHQDRSTTPAKFNWQNIPARSIVFYEQQEQEIPPAPPDFNNSAIYTNENKDTIGLAWAKTDVNLEPELTFFNAEIKNRSINAILCSSLAIIAFALIPLRIRVTSEKTTDEPVLSIHAEIALKKSGKTKE